MEYVNLYFAVCLVAYVIDVIATLAIVCVKPLRKWCWKKCMELGKEFNEIVLEVFPELEEE